MNVSLTATAHSAHDWMHEEHPVVTPLTGFFSGLLFILVVPGIFAAGLNALFPRHTVEDLFPFVIATLVVPAWLVAAPRTRRFGLYLWLGIVATATVVLGVGGVVLWVLIATS